MKKHVNIGQIFTWQQIELAHKLIHEEIHGSTEKFSSLAESIQKQIIEPSIESINKKLGQKNDATYLAYALIYALTNQGAK